MKIRVVQNERMKQNNLTSYYDRDAGKSFDVGDEREVTERRGAQLIAAGVAESIDERTSSNPEPKSTDTRTTSRGRRTGGYDDATE